MELSSKSYADLGELAVHMQKVAGEGLKILNKQYHAITIGCTPFFFDFASAHIHSSVKGMSENTWIALRQKLYSAQPLIDLLSQNSPVVGAVRAADVRLLLSNWSTFTDLDSTEMSHWFAIAYGLRGQTIEVRIPSSAPLFQVMGVAAMLRVVIEDDAMPIAIPQAKKNWNRVINYGSSSLSEISIPSILRYDGFKYKKLVVKTTDLWKQFYINYAEKFDKVLSTLPANLRKDVKEFYNFISEGHTLSDSYYEIINDYTIRDMEDKIAEKLADISVKSYNGGGAFDILPRNPKPFMPLVEKYFSIEEVQKLADKIATANFAERYNAFDTDALNLLLNAEFSPITNGTILNVIQTINDGEAVETNMLYAPQQRALLRSKVLGVERNFFTKGENFGVALAICKEAGLI